MHSGLQVEGGSPQEDSVENTLCCTKPLTLLTCLSSFCLNYYQKKKNIYATPEFITSLSARVSYTTSFQR
jgi:hypothetical protein